jgi:hypothetical protein
MATMNITFSTSTLGYDAESMTEIEKIFSEHPTPDAEPENDGPTGDEFIDIMKSAAEADTTGMFPAVTVTARKTYKTKS